MIKSLNLKNTQTVGTDVSFQELLKAFEDIDSGYANLRALNNQNAGPALCIFFGISPAELFHWMDAIGFQRFG